MNSTIYALASGPDGSLYAGGLVHHVPVGWRPTASRAGTGSRGIPWAAG